MESTAPSSSSGLQTHTKAVSSGKRPLNPASLRNSAVAVHATSLAAQKQKTIA